MSIEPCVMFSIIFDFDNKEISPASTSYSRGEGAQQSRPPPLPPRRNDSSTPPSPSAWHGRHPAWNKCDCNAWRPDPRLRIITLESPRFHQMWTSTNRTVHLKDLEVQSVKDAIHQILDLHYPYSIFSCPSCGLWGLCAAI
jgi:hypothetical protein